MSILKRTILFLFVIANLAICNDVTAHSRTPEHPYPYIEQEVFFQNRKDRIRLAGTLSLPLSARPCPAVVLCSGIGPQDRNADLYGHKLFLVIAHHLTRLGIAVLRVDDRGVGSSTGNFIQSTSADFAADALAAVGYLKTRKDIVHSQIGLLGHSEGGLVAPLAAAQSSDVAFLVMMAGPGLKGDQIVVGVGGLDLDGSWLRRDLISQIREAQERVFTIIKNERYDDASEAAIMKEAKLFHEIADRIRAEAPESEKQTAEKVASAIQDQVPVFLSRWFRFFITYDPRSALTRVRCPVLAVYGAKDVMVPAEANWEAVREALDSGGNTNYTALILPGLNHLFQTAQTGAIYEYDQIGETISIDALNTVSDWILAHTNQRALLQSRFQR